MNDTCAPSSRLVLFVILCFLILPPVVWGEAGTDHLAANETLNAGEYLTVLEGERILKMEGDGNLVLYGPTLRRQLWQSGTSGNPGAYYREEADGNLVVYSADDKLLWSSKTGGNPGATLGMEDGNLVIYSPSGEEATWWESGTSGNPGASYSLEDGNLVITSAADPEVVWETGTGGNPDAKLLLDDGNLSIVSTVVWETGTDGNPGATWEFCGGYLQVVSADGQTTLWRSDNDPLPSGTYQWWDFTDDGDMRIYYVYDPEKTPTGAWSSGTGGIPNPNWVMQDNGNLVIYSTTDSEVLWQTGTGGHPGSELVMEDDGNLVVKSLPPDLWQSGTSGNPGASYSLEDGNLVITTTSNTTVVWETGTGGNPGARIFLDDGNLGIVTMPQAEVAWSTGTNGNPGATLKFEYDWGLQVVSIDDTVLWQSDNEYLCLYYYQKYELADDGDLQVLGSNDEDVYNRTWHVVWSSGTGGIPNPELVMQEEGNLVITTSAASRVLWQTETGGHPGSELVMKDDGNQVIQSGPEAQLLWESHTAGNPYAWWGMNENDAGNLVILSPPSARKAIWSSGTGGHDLCGYHVKMQNDGNLVILDGFGQVMWTSDTAGEGVDPHLELQSDGNLVIYKDSGHVNPLWATNTFIGWMEKFGEHIWGFTLRDLAISGTHDSGTYGLDDRYWADDNNVPEIYFKYDGIFHEELVNWHWVKHHWAGVDWWVYQPDVIRHAKFMKSFAKTQPNSIYGQLNNGIRYLDMRVLEKHGGLYLIHTLIGPDVLHQIDKINDYLRANPYEIVILDFNHFYTQGGDHSHISDHMNRKLIKHILHKLGDLLIPPPADINELTISDIWYSGKQVVLFYNQHHPDGLDTSSFWPQNKLRSEWLDQQSLDSGGGKDGLKSAINAEADCVVNLQNGCENADNKLWVLQGILTFDLDTFMQYFDDHDWDKLLVWLHGNNSAAYSVNGWVQDWALTSSYNEDINILLGDWAEPANLVKTAIALNSKKIGLDPWAPGIEGLPLFDDPPPPAPQTWLEATEQSVPVIIPPSDIRVDASSLFHTVEFSECFAYDYIDGWLDTQSDAGAAYPIGRHQIRCWALDAAGVEGSATHTAWIVAHHPQADKTELWPVNRKMVTVTIDANVVPALEGFVTLSASVASSQPQEGMGPSDKGPDWTEPLIDQESGTIQVELRAERWNDIDRLYNITVTATDEEGNESHEVVQVMVPETKRANTPDCYNENANHPVGHCAQQVELDAR